jgi:hypothetical protein
MNLNGGQTCRLDRIKQCDAGMGIGTGVDDNAICSLKICLLNPINQGSLVVALSANSINTAFFTMRLDHRNQTLICDRAVMRRLSDAKHIEVWSV